MTLTSTTNKVSYSGNGATVAFSVSFAFWDADDLRVIHRDSDDVETVWTRGTQYTVTGGDGSTGTVTVSTSPTDYTPASGETLTIKSNLSDIQETDLPRGGELPSDSLEQQMDKMVRLIQQKQENLDRAPKFSETSTVTDIEFPDPSASKFIGWNAAATALTNLTLADFSTVSLPLSIANGGTAAASASTARTSLGLAIGTDVQAYDADTLKADTADVLTAGFAGTPYNAGTKSSGTYTPDEANGNLQYAVNGGAHTLAPPTNNGTIIVQYTNNGSAGAITTSGFTKVSGSFTTTNGDDFLCFITKNNGFSFLNIVAMQ